MIAHASVPRRGLLVAIALGGVLGFGTTSRADWLVLKLRHADLSGRSDTVVARHPSEDAARADAKRRNEANDELAYYYGVRQADSGDGSVVTNVLAQATKQVDEVLRRTRATAVASGMPIPAAGEVLGSYKQGIQDAYLRARQLKEGMLEFQGKAPEELFEQINQIIDAQFAREADLSLQQRLAELQEEVAKAAATENESRRAAMDALLERITSTTDPEQQERLLAELRELQESGALKSAALAEAEARETRADYEAGKQKVDSLQKMLDEGQKRQAEIVAKIKEGRETRLESAATDRARPPKPNAASLVGKKATGRLGVIRGGTRFFVEFRSGGVLVMGTAEEDRTFTGTWTQSRNVITMKAGASTFSGTLEGNRISGTRSRENARALEDTVDTWELTLETDRQYFVEMRWKVKAPGEKFNDWHWNSTLHGTKNVFSTRDEAAKKVRELERYYEYMRRTTYDYEFRIRERN